MFYIGWLGLSTLHDSRIDICSSAGLAGCFTAGEDKLIQLIFASSLSPTVVLVSVPQQVIFGKLDTMDEQDRKLVCAQLAIPSDYLVTERLTDALA
ncbi:hypothetical protein PAPYR_8286 [Paratrimastix pyriformis]|uniref:Uncharacterized protein n=1 Tax=Paratrimastix pyriformis TaxID=342808 RepID=A0ABQ8UAX2_9EUKA|nr:hypothetical protein PAPYR_8286 [Paratrimastix pyriformis]